MLVFCSGEYVAQFKMTVILMPNGPLKITGLPFDLSTCHSDLKVENEEVKVSISSLSVFGGLVLCVVTEI